MTDQNSSPDPLDRLRDLRPDTTILEREWPAAERAALLRHLQDDDGATRPPRFVTRRRGARRIAVPAAIAALAALIAGVLVVVLPDRNDSANDLPTLGEPFTSRTVVDTPEVGARQFAYRVTTESVTRNGHLVPVQRTEDWVAPNGALWSKRISVQDGSSTCLRDVRGAVTQSSLRRLPADPQALRAVLRDQVSGSNTVDEAVFVYVGDTLRGSDLLATASLRAAFVAVLSRTGGVAVHTDAKDSQGRSAIRVDFVDEGRRPGEFRSLYFDPDTFQLFEEATRENFHLAAEATSTPRDLPTATSRVTTTVEKVVDALPANMRTCPQS